MTGFVNAFVYLGEQPPREPVFKVLECCFHLHPFLTLILVTELPAKAASCSCQTLPFQTAGQNTFLGSTDSRSTMGFGLGTAYGWIETICRIHPRTPRSVASAISIWEELSEVEGLFRVGGY